MISNSHFIFSSILLTPFFFITLTLSFPHHTNFHPSPITTTPHHPSPPLPYHTHPSPPLPSPSPGGSVFLLFLRGGVDCRLSCFCCCCWRLRPSSWLGCFRLMGGDTGGEGRSDNFVQTS